VFLLRRSSSPSLVFFSVTTRQVFFFFFFLNPSYKFLTFLFHFWEARRSEECEREASLKSPESSKPEVRLRLKRGSISIQTLRISMADPRKTMSRKKSHSNPSNYRFTPPPFPLFMVYLQL
ncbi:unnamed protein product, partial [Arabidopsis halleri]